jgi:Spy/CpxP family protein refolding chaperone
MRLIRFRLLIAALVLLLGTALTQSQAADAPPSSRHHHEFGEDFGFGGHMMGFFADYLNLTDAQQTQMKAVLQKEHPALHPLMQQLHQAHQQLAQLAEGTYDEGKVRAVATQQAQTMVELAVQYTRIHSELFQLLTPEQQTKMKEFEANHAARMHKHMHSETSAPTEE